MKNHSDGSMNTPTSFLKGYNLVLASKSPRRRELLHMTGLDFTIADSMDIDESYCETDLQSFNVPEYLSRKKALAYSNTLKPGQILITADTVVMIDGKVLGKPHTLTEAKFMLSKLSGRPHEVITGITLYDGNSIKTFSASTKVLFDNLSEHEIDYYVDNFKPLDKAGSYGIQEYIGAIGIERIEGSFYNVMGLPVHRLYRELELFVKDIQPIRRQKL